MDCREKGKEGVHVSEKSLAFIWREVTGESTFALKRQFIQSSVMTAVAILPLAVDGVCSVPAELFRVVIRHLSQSRRCPRSKAKIANGKCEIKRRHQLATWERIMTLHIRCTIR
jgi:hypothetical protein